jgi:hypothetical protein
MEKESCANCKKLQLALELYRAEGENTRTFYINQFIKIQEEMEKNKLNDNN